MRACAAPNSTSLLARAACGRCPRARTGSRLRGGSSLQRAEERLVLLAAARTRAARRPRCEAAVARERRGRRRSSGTRRRRSTSAPASRGSRGTSTRGCRAGTRTDMRRRDSISRSTTPLRVGTAVDVVAEEDQPVARLQRQHREQRVELVELAVDVADRVEHAQAPLDASARVGRLISAPRSASCPQAASMSARAAAAQRDAQARRRTSSRGKRVDHRVGRRAIRRVRVRVHRDQVQLRREIRAAARARRRASSGESFTPSISVYSKKTGRRGVDASRGCAASPSRLREREAPVERHQHVAHRVGRGVQRDREIHRHAARAASPICGTMPAVDTVTLRGAEREGLRDAPAGAPPRAPRAGSAAARPCP